MRDTRKKRRHGSHPIRPVGLFATYSRDEGDETGDLMCEADAVGDLFGTAPPPTSFEMETDVHGVRVRRSCPAG